MNCRYGITPAELEILKGKYDGMCWVCRIAPGVVVDHNHATGRVRSWCCHGCNLALGYLEKLREECTLQAALDLLGM